MLDIGLRAFKGSCFIFPHTDENKVYLILSSTDRLRYDAREQTVCVTTGSLA